MAGSLNTQPPIQKSGQSQRLPDMSLSIMALLLCVSVALSREGQLDQKSDKQIRDLDQGRRQTQRRMGPPFMTYLPPPPLNSLNSSRMSTEAGARRTWSHELLRTQAQVLTPSGAFSYLQEASREAIGREGLRAGAAVEKNQSPL